MELDQGGSSQRQFERGRAEDWLAAKTPGPDFEVQCDPDAYVSSLSAHGGRLHRDVCVSVLLEDFATFMTFLPALVGAGSGNRNLRRQISARSTETEC